MHATQPEDEGIRQPGEPLADGPTLQRLRVAMSKLRKLGVPLEHDGDDGYRLTFDVPPLVV